MSVTPSPIGGFAGQFFDNNGQPLSGGKIYTYAAGTTTPQATYTSALGITPHANPIILDSAGRVPGGEIWLTDGLIYKFKIDTATDVLIGTYDNITGVNSNFINYTIQEEVITATAGQTVFNLSTINYTPGTNSLSVYIDGVNQYVGDSYLETDSDTVTFTAGLHVGAEVKFTTAVPISTGVIDAGSVGYTANFTGAVGQTVQTKLEQYVSVKDFGAVGDGMADDTAAILAALAALTNGGGLYFPQGTYKFLRGNGALIADTIVANDVLIYGDGAGSKISGYNGAGATPNDVGNQFYNVFQATNRSNITIRDIGFEGYTTPIALFSCTNVVVDNIKDNAQLINAGGYMRDKSIYLDACSDIKITNSRFLNFQFAVYVSGSAPSKSARVNVNSCSFEHTTAIGSYDSPFPVGVYWYFSDNCIVSDCTFKNIYSSVDNGTTGTGMGYGVYEGDGTSTAGVISNNTFQLTAKGSKNHTGIYIAEMEECAISGNTFFVESGGRMVSGILLDSKNQNSKITVSGNTFDNKSTATASAAVRTSDGLSAGGSIRAPKISVNGNVINGFSNAVRQEFLGNTTLLISNNVISATTSASIFLEGSSTVPLKFPVVIGNTITASGTNAILCNAYVVSVNIFGNTILDGNTTNQAADLGAAVLFTSFSYGSFICNNVIGNTAFGGGLFTFGVQNVADVNTQIFKNTSSGNTFIGLSPNTQFGRWWNVSPTNGIFDVNKGDFLQNVQLNAGGVPGWHCVETRNPALTLNASSASTTVTVSSTGSISAGDIVVLCKNANPYDSDYSTITEWHVDTVASVSSPTTFVLTSGIPVGDGTYVAGVASVRTARFKAAAAIAA